MIRIVWRYDRGQVSMSELAGSSPEAVARLALPPNVRATPVFEGSREKLAALTESMPEAMRQDSINDLARYDQTYVEDEAAASPVLRSLEAARRGGTIASFEVQLDIGPQAPALEADDNENETGCQPIAVPAGVRSSSWDRCQRYLGPAAPPGTSCGVDARFAWTLQGGRGGGVRLVDLEGGWNLDHEDLKGRVVSRLGTVVNRSHGTAVLGILWANHDNGVGVKGMVPNARIGVAPLEVPDEFPNPERLMQKVAEWLGPGDVLLIEVAGIRPDLPTTRLPVEAWSHGIAALNTLHQENIYVVEVAGNGGRNLDSVPGIPASNPALMVGAGEPRSGQAASFSNRGRRVDLQGWGGRVVTTGSSSSQRSRNLQFSEPNRCYTKSFDGTSSAAAIVAGCVTAISGVVKANDFDPLSAEEMKELLIRTGSFPDRAENNGIGPLPNLRTALLDLEADLRARTPGFQRFRRVQAQ